MAREDASASEVALTIGEVARAAGVGVETVRYYQRRGLIPAPPRVRNGRRLYGQHVLGELRFIRSCAGLGFQLRDIALLLAVRRAPRQRCSALHDKLTELSRHLGVEQKRLASRRRAVARLLRACAGGRLIQTCGVIERFDAMHPLGDGTPALD